MEQRFALILGNSLYDDATLARLSAPQGDAASFADVLKDPEIGGFSEVNTLVNQPANEIRKSIARFFANRGRDDLLLLYFSGHGVLDDRGRLFLAAKDTEHDLLNATAIDAAFITDAMDHSRSNRQVLILDCCHSGAFARGAKGALGASVGTALTFEGTGSGRVILTATDATQYAWEGDQIIGAAQSSVFTHHLVEGLRSGQADRDADGWIALDEWFDYVYDRVVAETPKQTPGKWSYKQQGEIRIARSSRPLNPKAALPQELLDTLADPRSWVREGAVAELDRLLRTASPHLASAARAALEDLRNDDSRRVAAAAAAILSAAPGQQVHSPGEGPEPHPISALPKVQTFSEPLSPAGGTILDQSSLSMPPQPEPEAKRQAAAITPQAPHQSAGFLRGVTDYLISIPGVIALLWGLGWIASLALALLLDNGYMLIAGWAIAGLIADLVIWRMRSTAHLIWLPLLTLGWPVLWIIVYSIQGPLYTPVNDVGSDIGKQNVITFVMLLWTVLGSLLACLRVLSISPAVSRPWSALLSAVFCWGVILLITMAISGTHPWEIAFNEIRSGSITVLFYYFGNSLVAYFGLGLNGFISGLVGSYLWHRWVHPI